MERFLPIFISLLVFAGIPFMFSMLAFFKKKIAFKILGIITDVIGTIGSLFIPLLITLLLAMLSLGQVKINMGGLIAVILIGFGSSLVFSIICCVVDKPVIYYIKWGIYALILVLGTILFIIAPSETTSSSASTSSSISATISLLI